MTPEQACTKPGMTLVERYALPPREIEARSLGLVAQALGETFVDEAERTVATRIVYAAGDLSLAPLIRFGNGAVEAGCAALRAGATIVSDVRMVLSGIDAVRCDALGCRRRCAIDDPEVAQRAHASGLPRAVEAMRLLQADLDGTVVVIGNAPTALLALLDLIDTGRVRPALVIGMPAGFVAATEATRELLARDVPAIAIEGTRGGSPLAAAAVNALLRLAVPQPQAPSTARTALLILGHGSRAHAAAEAMEATIERVRRRGLFPLVEPCFVELATPTLAQAIHRCAEAGMERILIVPYFLHRGMHIRRDIPQQLKRELEAYPGLSVSLGVPIGMRADLAEVMLASALDTLRLPDVRTQPLCTGACLAGGPPLPCCSVGLPAD